MRRKEVALVEHRRAIRAVKIIQLVDRAHGGNLVMKRVVQVDGDPGRHLPQRRLVHDVHNGREVAHLGGVEHGDDVLVVEGLGAVVAAARLDLVEQRLVLVPDARVDGGREVGVLVGQADGAGGNEARVLAAVDLVDDGGHVGRDAADGRADNLELRRVRLMELGGPCGGRGARGVSPHGDFRVVADSGQRGCVDGDADAVEHGVSGELAGHVGGLGALVVGDEDDPALVQRRLDGEELGPCDGALGLLGARGVCVKGVRGRALQRRRVLRGLEGEDFAVVPGRRDEDAQDRGRGAAVAVGRPVEDLLADVEVDVGEAEW